MNGKNILCYNTECYLDAISAIFQEKLPNGMDTIIGKEYNDSVK